MADFSKVGLDIVFSTLFPNLKDLLTSIAKMFNGTSDLNIPDGTIRWSSANRRFEMYTLATDTWAALLDMADDTVPYLIRAQEANHADTADYADDAALADHADTADLATNSTNLDSRAASEYYNPTRDGDLRIEDGGTGASSAGGAPWAQKSLNLSDMDATSMRANLGLTSAATTPVGTSGSYLTTNDRALALANSVRINGADYERTQFSLANGASTTVSAPSGYRLSSATGRGVEVTDMNDGGTSITVKNADSMMTSVSMIWVKNT